jgi:hypothetical protein
MVERNGCDRGQQTCEGEEPYYVMFLENNFMDRCITSIFIFQLIPDRNFTPSSSIRSCHLFQGSIPRTLQEWLEKNTKTHSRPIACNPARMRIEYLSNTCPDGYRYTKMLPQLHLYFEVFSPKHFSGILTKCVAISCNSTVPKYKIKRQIYFIEHVT